MVIAVLDTAIREGGIKAKGELISYESKTKSNSEQYNEECRCMYVIRSEHLKKMYKTLVISKCDI